MLFVTPYRDTKGNLLHLSLHKYNDPNRERRIRDAIDRLLRSIQGYTHYGNPIDILWNYVIEELKRIGPDKRPPPSREPLCLRGGGLTLIASAICRERYCAEVRYGDFLEAIYEDVFWDRTPRPRNERQ